VSTTPEKSERRAQRLYWEAVGSPTVESMMLDSNAKRLDALERPEILSAIPLSAEALRESHIVEMGAGAGRFTGQLADRCASVRCFTLC